MHQSSVYGLSWWQHAVSLRRSVNCVRHNPCWGQSEPWPRAVAFIVGNHIMHISKAAALCVVPALPARRRLGGPEAVVILVVILVMAFLTALGTPLVESVSVLWAGGLLAVTLVRLATGSLRPVLHRLAEQSVPSAR